MFRYESQGSHDVEDVVGLLGCNADSYQRFRGIFFIPDVLDSTFLRNAGIYLQVHTVLQLRRSKSKPVF
jgi:hypothetical protein